MNHKLLFAALIVAFGVSEISVASPLCDRLKIPASQLAAFRPLDAHGKYTKNSMNDAVTCLNANWDKLSKRLEFRGSTVNFRDVSPAVSPAPTVVISYSPAASYNATIATPTAFLTQPVVHVNYLPGTSYSTNPIKVTALHLMDAVPTSNYQGSLATPIIYQTGHWNVNIDR
ncbi:hypothetical protein CRENPOLYSF2_1220010 [Crenothrix polyspora]|uniref:Uncharacterized protein n=1 Tax=Crenothrix polyspora TaxID=360316 RepID=A0A1R4H182_9GAMM|nr:hypothetical protein [Crenothrix polyspora]SJM89599.1 hypothetical protein CRENPOLYSF2_1220010 [Crenothrix polyspora]